MKTIFTLLAAAGVGFAVALVFSRREPSAVIPAATVAGDSELKARVARLEAALKTARARSPTVDLSPPPTAVAAAKASPHEIIAKLKDLKAGAGQTRGARQIVARFESLMEAGPAALPAIREFLARNEDVDFDAGGGSGPRAARDGKIITEFLVPPSLRLGLFEAVKNIGGADAEKALAEVLGSTGRGVEVAWLARALQELAPNQYRDTALAIARELLLHPLAAGQASSLDTNDRTSLYGVLALFNDASFAAQAQAQLVQADGKVDRSALNYLQQTLGEQSIAVAAQTWQDSRIPADQKEPLARLALNFAGANPRAEEMYKMAINDLSLPQDHRKDLIEDLNQSGFSNRRNFSAGDVALIQQRIKFIEQNAPKATDPVNIAAFAEAYKDLLNMQSRSTAPKP